MINLVKSFRPKQWVVLWFLSHKVKRVLATVPRVAFTKIKGVCGKLGL